jgi:hypothetical protein
MFCSLTLMASSSVLTMFSRMEPEGCGPLSGLCVNHSGGNGINNYNKAKKAKCKGFPLHDGR